MITPLIVEEKDWDEKWPLIILGARISRGARDSLMRQYMAG